MLSFTLAVIGQDELRDPQICKSMQHAYEQVLLSCIREELDKALAAVMAYHCKAGDPVFSAILRYDIDESPVHLETFTGACRISPASVPLWSDKLSFGRDEIKVVPDISFYSRPASGISFFPDPFE